MSGVLSAYAGAAREVVRAISTVGCVEYAEVVVTLPASVGARLDISALDDERASVVTAVEGAGATCAATILLVNPGEIVPRLSVLTLAAVNGEAPDDEALAGVVDHALPEGFEQAQPVAVTTMGDIPTRTLTDARVTHRIDVMLAVPGAQTEVSGTAPDPIEETP